jgi:hypothetical protein
MKVIVPALAVLGFAIAGVSLPTPAQAQNWQRITTEQQYRDRIVDRQILTNEGNRFTSHADGRVTGEWSGQRMVGAWQWHQGFWCRNVRLGQNPETGTDCQLVELRGIEVRKTRNQGRGEAGIGTLQ